LYLQILQSLTLAEAQKLVLKVLKQVMEEKLNSTNIELAVVDKAKGFRILKPDEVAPLIEDL
jgi:20S proteasome subunit alpha 5